MASYVNIVSYSYEGMYARTQLEMLDHNCGINRKQAVPKSNQLQNKIQFPPSCWAMGVQENYGTEIKMLYPGNPREMTKVIITTSELNEKLECIPKNIARIESLGTEKRLMEQSLLEKRSPKS